MKFSDLVEKVKRHPDSSKIGMILCHTGLVRQTSRDGRRVSGLRITVDHGKLEKVIAENKHAPGIVDIRVEIAEDTDLAVGDEIMRLVVAGDIREHVIETLHKTLNAIKTTVTRKNQFYVE